MSTIWTEITKEEYMEMVKDLKPLESFSDPDGVLPYGYGYPAMNTIWGNDPDFPVVKCEMRKANRGELEWRYTYYGSFSSRIQELVQ
jgi:hypothetical protein